jgi:hypothetical protein
MPRWNDTAARHDENNSSVEVEPGCTRDRRFTGFCLLSCLLSLSLALLPGSLHFHSWTSPALTNAMPWIHRGLSSGPCKPRRPLLTLQPNGYAKLPFACHRHHPPQTPSSAFDASRADAVRKHARALGSWHDCCCCCAHVQGHAQCPLLPPLRK